MKVEMTKINCSVLELPVKPQHHFDKILTAWTGGVLISKSCPVSLSVGEINMDFTCPDFSWTMHGCWEEYERTFQIRPWKSLLDFFSGYQQCEILWSCTASQLCSIICISPHIDVFSHLFHFHPHFYYLLVRFYGVNNMKLAAQVHPDVSVIAAYVSWCT